MNPVKKLKQQLLVTLSFFEPMSLEYIYLDLDDEFLKENPDLVIEDLRIALDQLVKEKVVKKRKIKKEEKWIKIDKTTKK